MQVGQLAFCLWNTNGRLSREHLRTRETPNLHIAYSENGENLGLVLK